MTDGVCDFVFTAFYSPEKISKLHGQIRNLILIRKNSKH